MVGSSDIYSDEFRECFKGLSKVLKFAQLQNLAFPLGGHLPRARMHIDFQLHSHGSAWVPSLVTESEGLIVSQDGLSCARPVQA